MDARPRCGSPHTEQEGDHAPHAVSETGCTNAPLAAHLRCNRHTPPPPSPPPRPSEVDSVFLDALVRYPLPLVSAAMACDVAGAEEELQLQLLYQPTRATMSSELRSPLAIAAPRHDGSVDERATAACAAAAVLSTALQHYWARPCSSAAAPLSPPIVDRELATSAPRAAPSWAAVSPFRACATPAFQSALRGLPGRAVHPAVRGAPWTAMDRWCHGLPTAADGAPPRKRVRTTTAAAAASPASLASKAGGGDVAEASLAALVVDGGGGRGLRGESLPRAASPRHCGAAAVLHRRVAENDDVLGFLLGTAPAPATSCPAPLSDAAPLPPLPVTQSRQHGALVETCGPPAQAVGGLGAAGSAHGGAPPPVMLSPATDTGVQESVAAAAPHRSMAVPFADDGATLAELREQCVRLGLLSTGHKSILVQRLRLYCSAVQPEQRQQPQDAAPSPSPSAAGIGVSAPPISPLPERVAVHDGSADVVRTAGSPPRTVFRYRSQSPSLPSAPPAVAVVAAASEVDEPRRPRRRLVQSPMEFLHSRFPTKAPLSSAEVAGGAPPLPTTTRAQEEALKGEAARVRWRWLVDVRERAAAPRGGGGGGGGRQHDAMLDIFHRQQVPIASVMLPAGDFMLSVELTPEEAAAAAAAAAHGDTEACGAATSADGDDGTSTSSSSVLSHLCSLVVERKTAADLDASVKGVRYSEQRRLLAASPFRLVVWLVEGTDVAQRGGHRRPPDGHLGRGGSPPPSRTPSPVPSCSSGGAAPPASPPPAVSSAECARQRVDTACASLGLHGAGFVVVRTRSTAESVQYLKALAVHVVRQLASRRLSRRCVVGSESGPLAGDAAGQRVCHGGAQETAAPLPPLRAGTRVPPCGDGTPCDATGDVSAAACVPCHSALHCFTPAAPCLDSVAALQRRLRARTAFPRMLMCVRGCSAALATLLSSRYGTLVGLWRELRRRGREVCDADPTIQRLTTAQTKVYVLLTEFLLATDYL
ncbi:ERCC4 domain containing protein [Novymonas esmeraldas]|uniref:Crossover junction endonuclease MUS81 n=1 Tax=Novymonas esmeraldas TaxID=1808958 RepID=A0AAW0ESF1_9TRYP